MVIKSYQAEEQMVAYFCRFEEVMQARQGVRNRYYDSGMVKQSKSSSSQISSTSNAFASNSTEFEYRKT